MTGVPGGGGHGGNADAAANHGDNAAAVDEQSFGG
jgi:hypothetical protein